jgi:hypothetical protein
MGGAVLIRRDFKIRFYFKREASDAEKAESRRNLYGEAG